MLVREMMSTSVVSCEAGASLADAVAAMIDQRMGSVVIVDDGVPAGIVTETDALQACYETGLPLSEISVEQARSDRMHTIGPEATIMAAVDALIEYDVKKLPVVDGLELVGIITDTDIVHNFPAIREEARRLARTQDNWKE